MVVVTVELWPGGDPTRKRHLGTAWIANDGTGDRRTGNYWVKLFSRGKRPRLWKEGIVRGFPRKDLLAWDLVYRALRNIVGSRNA